MRPAIEAVRATGTAVAEVALCYTGDLSDPDEKLYTLDYYLRLAERIVDAGAHVLAIKDMAGLLRAPAARTLVTALRERFDLPVHLHTHDTAGGQLGDAARRDRRRGRRGRRRQRVDGRHHVAAAAVRAGLRHRPLRRARPGCRWRRSTRSSPTGRRPAGSTRRSSPACPPRPAASTATRSPAASCPTCASRRSRSGSGEKFEQIEDMYAAANDILGNVVEGDPVLQGGRRPRPAPRRRRRRPGRVRREPGQVRHPRLGDRLPQRRARRPARRLARAVPHQGARGPHLEAAGRRAHRRAGRGAAGTQHRAARRSTSCCSPARPRSSPSRARSTATSRCCRPSTTSTGCAPARSTRSSIARGQDPALGLQAISEPDERGYPHRDGHDQRPAPPGQRARPQRRRRGRRRREGRPVAARPGRRAVPGRRDRRRRARATRSRPATPSPPSRR